MSRSTRDRRYAAASRVLLCVLAALLLVLPVANGDLPGAWSGDAAVEACDCCPDKTPGDGEDCCDVDNGACCATGASVTLTSTTTCTPQAQLPMLEGRAMRPVHLVMPRANGPPPTPPPIA